jgi:hypothetical protein
VKSHAVARTGSILCAKGSRFPFCLSREYAPVRWWRWGKDE